MGANDLLRLEALPMAISVARNAIMPGVVRTLRQAGLAMPGDMSAICFDDVEWFSFSVPPITAISTAYTVLAEVAVDLLVTRIRRPSGGEGRRPVLVEINFEFVLRRSTAAPRAGLLLFRETHLAHATAEENPSG
jgi:LacI family transcriptional regulator